MPSVLGGEGVSFANTAESMAGEVVLRERKRGLRDIVSVRGQVNGVHDAEWVILTGLRLWDGRLRRVVAHGKLFNGKATLRVG